MGFPFSSSFCLVESSFSSIFSVGSFLTGGVLIEDSSFGNVTLTEGCSSFVGTMMGGLAFCDLFCIGDSSTEGCSSFVGTMMGGLAFCDLFCIGDSSTEGCSSFVGTMMGGLAFCDLFCVGDSSTDVRDFLSRSLLPYLLYLLIQVFFLDIGLPTLLDMRA